MKVAKIKSIKKLDNKFLKYDIETAGNHNFFANGILVHNSAFGIERHPTQGLRYFKRNTERPISQVDRVLMKYYEPAIEHFLNLDEAVKGQLPIGWRFGMEYFVSRQPHEIAYDRVPKSGLVLSYIHVKNDAGQIVRTIQDKQELDDWADLLDVERAPIIFQGRLSEDQKIKVLDYLDTPFEALSNKFRTESFVKYILSVLSPQMKKTALNEDVEKSIEGIVFRFGTEDDVVLAKLVDPVFEAISKEKVVEKREPNEMYYLTVMDFANYIDTLDLKKIKNKGKTFDERYLNFMCAAFAKFLDRYGEKYKDLDFNEPSYLKKPEFDLNDRFIDNPETLAYIEEPSFRKMFRIFLAAFQKKKKKPSGMFTKDIIRQFNLTIARINGHLAIGLVTEGIPSFGEFHDALLTERADDEDEDEEEEEPEPVKTQQATAEEDAAEAATAEVKAEEDKDETYDESSEIAAKLDAILGKSEPEEPEAPSKKARRVNMIIGRFQPYHDGHDKMVNELYEANKLPVVLVAVNTDKPSTRSPFGAETEKVMLDAVTTADDEKLAGYIMVRNGFLPDVIGQLRPDYEPILWGVGQDRLDDYRVQVDLNFNKGNQLGLDPKFEIVPMERSGSGDEARTALADDSFSKFKGLVPKPVQGLYKLLRRDMERAKKADDEKRQ